MGGGARLSLINATPYEWTNLVDNLHEIGITRAFPEVVKPGVYLPDTFLPNLSFQSFQQANKHVLKANAPKSKLEGEVNEKTEH